MTDKYKETLIEKLERRARTIENVCRNVQNHDYNGYPIADKPYRDTSGETPEVYSETIECKLSSILDGCWALTTNELYFDAPPGNPDKNSRISEHRISKEIDSRTLSKKTFEAYLENAIFAYEHIKPNCISSLEHYTGMTKEDGLNYLQSVLAEHNSVPYVHKTKRRGKIK